MHGIKVACMACADAHVTCHACLAVYQPPYNPSYTPALPAPAPVSTPWQHTSHMPSTPAPSSWQQSHIASTPAPSHWMNGLTSPTPAPTRPITRYTPRARVDGTRKRGAIDVDVQRKKARQNERDAREEEQVSKCWGCACMLQEPMLDEGRVP